MTAQDAAGFYAVHRERPFFKSLCAFMTQGPCLPMVLEADNAIQRWRDLMGATDPAKAAAWDSGARGIEGYRHKYGVTDRKSALGKDVKEIGQRAARRTAERRVQEAQRRLGRERQHGRERGFLRERTRSLGR